MLQLGACAATNACQLLCSEAALHVVQVSIDKWAWSLAGSSHVYLCDIAILHVTCWLVITPGFRESSQQSQRAVTAASYHKTCNIDG